MIMYFSATGNCKYVAERIARELNDTAVSIEESDGIVKLEENEMLGIVTPVYWFELPVFTRKFLQKMSVDFTDSTYSFIVTTYGTTPGCTFEEAKRILAGKGLTLCAGFSVKMPDTWTPIFDLSDPEKVSRQNADAENYIADVLDCIRKRKKGNLMQNKMPYISKKISDRLMSSARRTKNFHVEESCIGCGLCAKRCPARN